jgi:FMN phosphatase YigB (HAD superfamily)
VSGILTSLGLSVATASGGPSSRKNAATTSPGDADISFVSLSYDVGHQKPDLQIFAAAAERGRAMLSSEDGSQGPSDANPIPASSVMTAPAGEWTYLHVGDNIEQDVLGAKSAGWNSILLDREGNYADQCEKDSIRTIKIDPGQSSDNRWKDCHIQVIQDLTALRHWKP